MGPLAGRNGTIALKPGRHVKSLGRIDRISPSRNSDGLGAREIGDGVGLGRLHVAGEPQGGIARRFGEV